MEEPFDLTLTSFNHRIQHMRMREVDYQDKYGEIYTCPGCKKQAYTYVEGGADCPHCDECWGRHGSRPGACPLESSPSGDYIRDPWNPWKRYSVNDNEKDNDV